MTQKYKRIIAIADIHGCFEQLHEMVQKCIKFDPSEDMLVFLGDYFDRGKSSFEVYRYLRALKEAHKDSIILLKGNHEEMFFKYMENKEDLQYTMDFLNNGGRETMRSFKNANEGADLEKAYDFLKENCKLYFKRDGFIFAHANFPHHEMITDFDYILWSREFDTRERKHKVVVGHTLDMRHPHWYGDLLCIDKGCFYSGELCAYDVLNSQKYFVKKVISKDRRTKK